MTNKPLVIGVGGFARSGKDMFVKIAKKILQNNGYSSTKLAFADALKDEIDPFLKESYGISAWTDDTQQKSIIRPLLVAHGCQKRLQSEGEYWIDKIDKGIETSKDFDVIFISDCRFPNEAEWLHEKWGGWFIHLKKYSVKGGIQYDSFTGKETGYKEWKQYDEAPNTEEAENDPLCEKQADYKLELENVIEREFRKTGIKITPDALIDNSYLLDEITLCLQRCPSLTIRNR